MIHMGGFGSRADTRFRPPPTGSRRTTTAAPTPLPRTRSCYDEDLDRAGQEGGELTRVFATWVAQVVRLPERTEASDWGYPRPVRDGLRMSLS